jgi:hypothetical protein
MKKKIVSKIIHEEIARGIRETFEAAKGPNDPTDDDEFDAASDAAQTAHDLGLVHKSYGQYVDPKDPSGKVVAKSVKGQLVKVNHDDPTDAEPASPNDQTQEPTQPTTPDVPPSAASQPDVASPPQELHPEAQGIADRYTSVTGSPEAAQEKLEKLLHSLDVVARTIEMRGRHAKKTQKWQQNQNQIKKHRDALYLLQNQQPVHSDDTTPPPPNGGTELTAEPEVPPTPPPPSAPAQEPPGKPGSIDPPLQKNGDPWEVEVDGKRGYIDVIEKDRDEAHITFHDGSYGWFRTNELNPVNKIGASAAQEQPAPTKAQEAADKIMTQAGDIDSAIKFAMERMQHYNKEVTRRSSKGKAAHAPTQLQAAKSMYRYFADAWTELRKRKEGDSDPKAK